MNTYTGQIMPAETFNPPHQPTVPAQNHAVIYYNDVSATMLGDVWGNLYAPKTDKVVFPTGSIVVKAEAVTPTPAEWDVVTGASTWTVFRPSTAAQVAGGDMKPEVLTVRPLQMSIRIKDPVASPETGWVFLAFVYDKDAAGVTPWDRFVPLGIMWGDDPEYARLEEGVPPGGALQETWINPNGPAFTKDTLGWGGRLAGPMDVATRHNVITPSGKRYQGANHLRASSCISCHSSSEFPLTANLYPSPNKSFPRDGEQFMLYDPGSEDWARWFQNNPGTEPLSNNIGGIGLDYDMVMMFALSAYNGAVGNSAFVQERFHVH